MKSPFKSDRKKQELLASYDLLLKAWPVAVSTRFIRTTWGDTFCIRAGNPANPPLILFHGVGDNSAVMWILNIAELSRHFHCIAVDTLGGPGKSEPNDRYWKDFNQVDWITEIIEKTGSVRINIAGVSNGGYMAYNYMTSLPDSVNKVVCIEGGMVKNPWKAIFSTIWLLFPEILFPTDKNMKKILAKLASPASRVYQEHPEIVDHVLLAMRSHNRNAMFRHKLSIYDPDQDQELRSRMLFLLGDFRIKEKKEFTDILDKGNYTYKVIAGAGHGLNHEQPEMCNQEIIFFLKK